MKTLVILINYQEDKQAQQVQQVNRKSKVWLRNISKKHLIILVKLANGSQRNLEEMKNPKI